MQSNEKQNDMSVSILPLYMVFDEQAYYDNLS